MKASLFFFGPACLLMFLGPESHFNGALMRTKAEAPSWIAVPEHARIAEIDYRMTDAGPQGHMRVTLDEHGEIAFEEVRRRFTAAGFVVDEMDVYPGSGTALRGLLSASNPGNGRHAIMVAVSSWRGDELHITFSGPPAASARGGP